MKGKSRQDAKALREEVKSLDRQVWETAMMEHEAAGKILKALEHVSQNERRRILQYMYDRYVTNPDPE
jgi:hypothetical protein